MLHKVTVQNENVSNTPNVDLRYVAKPGVQLVMGDLHSSADKLLFFLRKHDVLRMTHQDSLDFVRIVNKHYTTITADDLIQLNTLIDRAVVNPEAVGALLLFIGDETGDRRTIDLFVLLLAKKLKDNNINYIILLSNHGMGFIHSYEILSKFESTQIPDEQSNSIKALQYLIDKGLISKKYVMDLIEKYLIPHYELFYVMYDKNELPTISFHAPFFSFARIKQVARQLGVPCKLGSKKELEETRLLISNSIRERAEKRVLHKLLHSSQKNEQTAFHAAIWDRMVAIHFCYIMPKKNELKKYKKSYIVIQPDILIYVNEKGKASKCEFMLKNEFINAISLLPKDPQNTIYLSSYDMRQITKYDIFDYLPLNDFIMKPSQGNAIYGHDKNGFCPYVNHFNTDNTLSKLNCFDNRGTYQIVYALTDEKQIELDSVINQIIINHQAFFTESGLSNYLNQMFSLNTIFSFCQIDRINYLLSNNDFKNFFLQNKNLIPILIFKTSNANVMWDVLYILKMNNWLDTHRIFESVLNLSDQALENFHYLLTMLDQKPFESSIIAQIISHDQLWLYRAILSELKQANGDNITHETLQTMLNNATNEYKISLQIKNFLLLKRPDAAALINQMSTNNAITFNNILTKLNHKSFLLDHNLHLDIVISVGLNTVDHLSDIYEYILSSSKDTHLLELFFSLSLSQIKCFIHLKQCLLKDNVSDDLILTYLNLYVTNTQRIDKIVMQMGLAAQQSSFHLTHKELIAMIKLVDCINIEYFNKNENYSKMFTTHLKSLHNISLIIYALSNKEPLKKWQINAVLALSSLGFLTNELTQQLIDLNYSKKFIHILGIFLDNQILNAETAQYIIDRLNVIDNIDFLMSFILNVHAVLPALDLQIVDILIPHTLTIENVINRYQLTQTNSNSIHTLSTLYLNLLYTQSKHIQYINHILLTVNIDKISFIESLLNNMLQLIDMCSTIQLNDLTSDMIMEKLIILDPLIVTKYGSGYTLFEKSGDSSFESDDMTVDNDQSEFNQIVENAHFDENDEGNDMKDVNSFKPNG